MNKERFTSLNIYHKARIASIVLGVAVFLLPGIVVSADFVGSDECQECHETNYRDWSASGHPYKLMKAEDARHRPIPLPLGTSWDEVSYVIGGYKWKSRYIDSDGYIITVTEDEDGNSIDGGNQYNYLTGEWVGYHGGEVNKPYDCGTCHTTNWVANDNPEDLSGNQGELPGMWGKFDMGGIHCEQCHGNGTSFSEGMQVDDSADACGACHYRGSPPGSEVNTIPASGGFIKHHEQYNEHLAGPHAEMKCVDCHNPHKRAEFSIWKDGESEDYPFGMSTGAECGVNCHSDKAESFAPHSMADYAVECKDCHMPFATKSANQLGDFEGDLQTHIFYINTEADGKMFTEAGDFVALDGDGKGAVTLDFACKRCHETAAMGELAKFAKNFHGADTTKTELDFIGLNPGLTGNWWGGASRDGEGFLVDFSFSNGKLVMVASFYTYDSEGNQVWLIGAGLVAEGSTSVTVDLTLPEGAMWGADFDPADLPTPRTPWGTAVFTFPSCIGGNVALTPNADMMTRGFTTLGYDLTRDITVTGIQCPTFVNNPL